MVHLSALVHDSTAQTSSNLEYYYNETKLFKKQE
jgi:hypothetical protein